tara:strand:- start:62 stop:364 length:303 start_codon:yes stop_codon:yes gene_type:complete
MMSSKVKGGNFIISYDNFKGAMDSVFDKEEYIKKVRAQSLMDLQSSEEVKEDEVVDEIPSTIEIPEPELNSEDNVEEIDNDDVEESENSGVLIKKNELLL